MVFVIPDEFDPEGDLVLVAFARSDPSKTPVRLRVCSQALRRSSPVWKKMLYGDFRWKESKPTDGREWVVELPEDDVYPLKMVLSIIHGTPTRLDQCSVEEVYQILILTHKYDMVKIVNPWCDKWLDNLDKDGYNIKATVQGLFIAWELGSEEIFAQKLEYLAMHTEIDSQDRLIFRVKACTIVPKEQEYLGLDRIAVIVEDVSRDRLVLKFKERMIVLEEEDHLDPDCVAVTAKPDSRDRLILKVKEQTIVLEEEDHLGPLDILKAIADIRVEMIEQIISLVYDNIKVRTGKEPYCDRAHLYTPFPFDGMDRKKCDITVVGGIYHAMIRTRGAPLSEHAEDIKESVVELADCVFDFMGGVEALHDGEPCSPAGFGSGSDPARCIRTQTRNDIYRVVRGTIGLQHLQYMAQQRLKTEISCRPLNRYASKRRYWAPYDYVPPGPRPDQEKFYDW